MTATVEGGTSGLTVYGTRSCSDCVLARSVLDAQQVDYHWVDISNDPEAADHVMALNGGYRSVPTILFPDGRVLVEPSRTELLAALDDGALPAPEAPAPRGR